MGAESSVRDYAWDEIKIVMIKYDWCIKGLLMALLVCVGITIVNAQVDTLHYMVNDSTMADMPVYNDFEPTVAGFAIAFMLFGIICILIGIGLAALAAAIIIGFVSIGILSASVIGGLYKRSFSTAFKILIVSFSTFLSMLGFGIAAVILNMISHWTTLPIALMTGAGIGAAGGVALGMAVYYTFKWLVALIKEKVG